LADAPIVAAELDRFRQSSRRSPAWGTAHIRKALVELGDPQDRIPPAIHITGTNGKGSTGAFIRGMAEAAGLRVHVFTSPHLMRVNERIRVSSRLVEDDVLADVLDDIARRTQDLTYFEALTAAAFCLFAQNEADISIIEVGAGGATDATNVMNRPAACIVTPISRDHESLFGVEGVAAIARLKAGIFRQDVPALLADQPAMAEAVLREEARTIAAPVRSAGEDWKHDWEGRAGEAFIYESRKLRVRAPWLGLPGLHQSQNAAVACAALEVIGDKRITPEAMAAGLRETVWPARLQRLRTGPLAREDAIWIDAAHNPGGAAALASAIRAATPEIRDRVSLIVAMQAVKDIEGVLSELVLAVDEIIACPLPDSGGQEGGPGADPQDIAAAAEALGASARIAPGLGEAVAIGRQGGAERIYIAGSVYLCGAALSANGENVE
jgi:dihydrofolate synthase/folylpolyglutamate synthase